TVKKWRIEDKHGQYSRLLQVEVIWHAPFCGPDKIDVAVGHLHNETAKKDNNERRRFFDAVAECCAGGARILGMDLNMALFGLVPEMAKRHVGVTLISHHYEWRPNGTCLYDTLGPWVVGPMNLKKSTILSPRCHALAGAYHPVLIDRAQPRGARGYKASQFVYNPPALVEGLDPSALADEINAIENDTWQYDTGSQEIARTFGLEPWAPVRMHKTPALAGRSSRA
ncbi:MAG: hypothetical protein GY772_30975, partial [bacterium]|nr:hypothetical protein [bacterium]